MSTQPMPMVQVFAPDGTLGDIPYDKLHDALGAGAKIAAKVKAPDGTVGFIPGDRVPEAMKAGATRVPLDMHDADGGKPGFWSQAYDKAASMFPSKESALRAVGGSGVTAYQLATNPGPTAARLLQEAPGLRQAEEYLRSRDTGASAPRSALNSAGTMVGVNPEAEEHAAAQGNTAGVLADATVPAAAAVGGYGASLAGRALAPTISDALIANKPQVQGAADFLMHPEQIPGKTVQKLADLIPNKPEYPGAPLPSYEDFAANRGAEMNQARAMQDVQLRREATAKAAADRAAVKAAVTKPLSPIYGPPSPTAEQLSGVPLSELATPTRTAVPISPSEGRPATWTNEKVRELAAWGDPDAIDQARARGFGRIPLNYSLTDITPKSVTRFSSQGVPLSDLVANSREPNLIYRARTEGIPEVDLSPRSHAHATASAEEAEQYAAHRNGGEGQVVSPIDLNKFEPHEIEAFEGPNGKTWYKFKRQLTEDDYE